MEARPEHDLMRQAAHQSVRCTAKMAGFRR